MKGLLTGLKIGKLAVFKGFSRITTLFSSNLGIWGWIVLTSVLVFDHQAAIQTSVENGSLGPILTSYGKSLGSSIEQFTGAMLQVPQASGWAYAELGWTAISSAATVLWYFKAFLTITVKAFGENIPPIYIYITSIVIYFLVVYAATGWLPDAGTFEALSNLPELFDFGKVNPLADPVNATNVTNSTGVDALDTPVE